MTIESDLQSALAATVSGRAFPLTAPFSTTKPFVIYQQVGGEAVSFYELAMPSKRNGVFQVRVWDKTLVGAVAVARAIEVALVTSNTLRATPIGALVTDYGDEVDLYGTIQQFSIWFDV